VGEELGVGPYTIVCKYHADQGMTGRLTVVAE
jgi:plastocyanin